MFSKNKCRRKFTQTAVLFFPLGYKIFKNKEPIAYEKNFIGYRLCVLASGSVITDTFSCFALINISRLHFGQYNGKFWSIVSSRITVRVLLLHTGHNNQTFVEFIFDTPPCNNNLDKLAIRI